jgi:hypothetical protein
MDTVTASSSNIYPSNNILNAIDDVDDGTSS